MRLLGDSLQPLLLAAATVERGVEAFAVAAVAAVVVAVAVAAVAAAGMQIQL